MRQQLALSRLARGRARIGQEGLAASEALRAPSR